MKIYRDFVSMKPGDGTCRVEIELTSQELADAFYEKEHQWDEDYVLDLAMYSADGCADNDPEMERLNALRSDPELLSRVAYRYRKYMLDQISGDAEYDCFEDAYKYIRRDMLEEVTA